jgi:hypothetical protein
MAQVKRQHTARPRTDQEAHTGPRMPALAALKTAETPAAPKDVQVISGASVQSLPLAGTQVGQVRELLGAILHIAPQALALVNGRPVRTDHQLASGDTLEFVHHAGEKGGGDGTRS